MSLDSFMLSYLNHDELHRLCNEAVSTIDEFFATHSFLGQVRDEIQARAADLRRSLDRDPGSELTEEIRSADSERDDAYRAYRAGVDFARRHFDAKTRAAGERLNALNEAHGKGMLEAGYGQQTTLADALLAALAKTDNAQALKVAGLDAFVTRFQQKQDAFKELVRRRQDAEATSDLPPLRATRTLLHDHLNLVEAALNFLFLTEPATVEPAIRSLNQRVQDIVTPAKARRTRRENGVPNPEAEELVSAASSV